MNAKKIMGAVLVALLALTAFAGVAAADTTDIGSVPAYTAFSKVSSTITFGGNYVAEDGTVITPVGTGSSAYFAENAEALGKVYKGTATVSSELVSISFTLVAPTAPVSAIYGGVSIIGQTVSETVAEGTTFTVGGTYANNYVFIKDGVVYDGTNPFDFTPGKWAVAANLTGQTGISSAAKIIGLPYYFTVAKTESSITAAKDIINIGESVVINVLVPGSNSDKIYFDDAKLEPVSGQAGVSAKATDADGTYVTVTLGLDGAGTVAFKGEDKGKATVTLGDNDVEITIQKGTITATADADFYYIGKPIAISGTTTAGSDLFFYIEGTNFDFMNIDALGTGVFTEALEVENGAWTVEFDSTKIVDGKKKLVAGTYTIIVATENKTAADVAGSDYKTLKELVMSGVYGTAAVTMTQPFITDVKANEVAVQGTDYEITGTAIAAKNVRLYVFGTSYFNAFTDATDDEDAFEFEIKGVDLENMAPGTYFYLIQHPMSDGLFNVWNGTGYDVYAEYFEDSSLVEDGDFFYSATASISGENVLGDISFIFNAWDRGTNYAAQALLNEISGQNIDDIFVQGAFEVAAQKLTINPIPAEVAKGTKLAVTGSTNSGEGVEVIVNVLAGKFGATVKGDENAATFLTAKAVTEEDGTFEAAIDTSKLEVGSYIVTVEIAGTMYDSAAVEIVEAGDEPVTPEQPEEPEQPEQPEEPVAPATPGFGALAALAGLGAVAVLLLRRE